MKRWPWRRLQGGLCVMLVLLASCSAIETKDDGTPGWFDSMFGEDSPDDEASDDEGWLDSIYGMLGMGSSKEKPTALTEFTPRVNVKIGWKAGAGKAGDFLFTPAVQEDDIYAAGYEGEIVSVDAATGKLAWDVSNGKLSGGIGAGEGLVLAGTPKGEVVAYSGSGKALWKVKVTSEVLSAPQIMDSIVIVRSGDNRIYALDAVDGTRKWMYERALPPLTIRSYANPLVAGGGVFAGFPGGKLVALDLKTGNVGWEVTVAQPQGVTELERIVDITSSPQTDGQHIYAVAYRGRLVCIDPPSGNIVWARPLSSTSGLALDARNVYVTDTRGIVYAFDKANGSAVWKQDKLIARRVTAPQVVGRYVVVADYKGYLHFLSREDGSFAARVATDGNPIGAQPQVIAGGLVAQTSKGNLYAVVFE